MKNHKLCIDVGNTNIKGGIFEGDTLVKTFKGLDNIEELKKKFKIDKCIISSVRKNIEPVIKQLKSGIKTFVILDHNTDLPIKINYKTPGTLGKDRIAAAVGAYKLFPAQNVIIVDAGTCITYDFLDKNGVFQGGNIAPGIHMRAKAMHEYTSALPLVEIEENSDILGKSTREALQNGALLGTFWEISAFIQEIIDKYGESLTIFTGGDAKYFVNKIKTTIFANSNLVLIGLNEILKKYD